MVTAGVYMMVRSNSLFYYAELTSFIVTIIGVSTAIMAGFIALGQWDVKRVLAYSTVSQLGFMVAAVGLGAYAAAMFHLVTHAVFKALLFLGSGSIIHGMEHGHHHLHDHHGHDDHEDDHREDHGHADHFDPQDMRFMGGLRHKMPITYWTYFIGTLALAGIFPFAGFWSKDEILVDAFKIGWEDGELKGFIALLVLLAAAGFTAFYMWRQVSLVFYGAPRHAAADHASESGRLMTIPLIILAIGSTLIGFINLPSNTPILGGLIGEHYFTDFLGHAVVHIHTGVFLWWLALGATILAVGAIFAARGLYSDAVLNEIEDRDPLELNPQSAPAFALANAKLYWDEVYARAIEGPYNRASRWLAQTLDWALWHDFVHERVIFGSFHEASRGLNTNVDKGAVDQGIMFVTTQGISLASRQLRRLQTGFVRTYAIAVVLGTVFILVVIMLPIIRDLLGV
jgi:NADH-quinone oxidoreductase subunit L